MSLSRQDLPVLEGSRPGRAAAGAYVLADGDDGTIVATGSEVWVALEAREKLAAGGAERARGLDAELGALRAAGRELPARASCPTASGRVSVEAGISLGWDRYAATQIAIDRFGASAPGTEVLERLGHHHRRTSPSRSRPRWLEQVAQLARPPGPP